MIVLLIFDFFDLQSGNTCTCYR